MNDPSKSSKRQKELLDNLQLHHCDPKLKNELENLCCQFSDIFALENDQLTTNNFYDQQIHLNTPTPVYIKNYRIPEAQKEEMNLQINKMLDDGIVQNSYSPYNSPILLVP